MRQEDCDVLVIGAGLIGRCAALALGSLGYRTLLVEKQQSEAASRDRRVLALAEGSRLILSRLGLWASIADVTPIEEIVVSDQTQPRKVHMRATECDVPALGYVTHFESLISALEQHLGRHSNVCIRYGCDAQLLRTDDSGAHVRLSGPEEANITSALVIHAEGARIASGEHGKQKDYTQWAIVSAVRATHARASVAYEHFTESGPIALLPLRDHQALVWTVPEAQRETILALDSAEFCRRLEDCLGVAEGSVSELEAGRRRAGYPLSMHMARQITGARSVRIGNAAQQLHPVAAQGFNLGLRDVWHLSESLWDTPTDPGASDLLRRYASARQYDRQVGVWLTDSMVKLFGDSRPLARASRGAALTAFAKFKSLRAILAHRMMFGTH